MEVLKRMINSAEVGDNTTLESLLSNQDEVQRNLCLKSTNQSGLTPLLAAVKSGQLDTVKLLVEKYRAGLEDRGAMWCLDDKLTHTGITPLWMAAYAKNLEMVKYLLNRSAEVDGASNSGSTPLIVASFYKNFEIIKTLVKHGADVNRGTSRGHTALMNVSSTGCKDIAEFLVEHGADINKPKLSGIPIENVTYTNIIHVTLW